LTNMLHCTLLTSCQCPRSSRTPVEYSHGRWNQSRSRRQQLNCDRAMMWATLINGMLGCIMMITFCFAVGDNLQDILDSPSGIPVIQLLYNVTGSKAGTVVMSVVLLILNYFSTITTIASSSRQTWAFARDKGFPFSDWLAHVSPGRIAEWADELADKDDRSDRAGICHSTPSCFAQS